MHNATLKLYWIYARARAAIQAKGHIQYTAPTWNEDLNFSKWGPNGDLILSEMGTKWGPSATEMGTKWGLSPHLVP